MREYILGIARDLYSAHTDATMDEIAATAGLDAAQVHDYFRSLDDVRDALAPASAVAA